MLGKSWILYWHIALNCLKGGNMICEIVLSHSYIIDGHCIENIIFKLQHLSSILNWWLSYLVWINFNPVIFKKIESRKSKESFEYLKVIIIWIELITIKTC